jgi:radical SAM protein with 4Fe4S-binding SPASM domain
MVEKNIQQNILIAGWSLTNMCNLHCKHCYNASGKQSHDELTFAECIEVADKLKSAGVVAVNFGGGECALRPDFIDLCKYLKNLGIKISYTTNGTVFPKIKQHLDLFHDIGVSIDFADEKKHDEFRGVTGVYRKAIASIKYLVDQGMDTEVVTCITKQNCSIVELKKIHKLCEDMGVKYWRLNRFRTNGRGILHSDELALTKDNLRNAYTFLSKFRKTTQSRTQSISEPIFGAAFGGTYAVAGDPSGSHAFRIQPNGEVSPSVFLKETGGNIKEKSVDEILSSDIFRKIRARKRNGKCRHCSAYGQCQGGDAGASYLAYGHFNGPDPLCWLTRDDIKPKAVQKIPRQWNVHELYLCTLYVSIKKKMKLRV